MRYSCAHCGELIEDGALFHINARDQGVPTSLGCSTREALILGGLSIGLKISGVVAGNLLYNPERIPPEFLREMVFESRVERNGIRMSKGVDFLVKTAPLGSIPILMKTEFE